MKRIKIGDVVQNKHTFHWCGGSLNKGVVLTRIESPIWPSIATGEKKKQRGMWFRDRNKGIHRLTSKQIIV